ncbi:PorP/SprF family type IX secretion system membrane protein [Hymenobacter sp. BT175]|uniref:PorP/SprF family type IX secretion system membrane protein n=1 Tax=Hymenobacter translucens TaxID=2886507 RepID=UPI001D0E27A8|nr:PorP/SprF family type IX secretion system membrane protein [Hymenobacter translucens]MCC2545721.1 PorP/SprF family type IX secretion system membrane protein [Hymenobacter translucens]
MRLFSWPFSSAFPWLRGSLRPALLTAGVAAGLGISTGARAQDLYFSQPYANRQQANPAFAGLLDDYGVTLSYRNQFPTLAGSFQTTQLAGDYRLNSQRGAVGLLLNLDRTGSIGYTRFEASGIYAYHSRLTPTLSFSGGLKATYGNQRISYDNLVFGDQLSDEGVVRNVSAEVVDFQPVSYFSLGTGVLLYSDQFWLGLAGHHLNQPDLAFRTESRLPIRLNVNTGYKIFFARQTQQQEYRELSLTPTLNYTRQGGSQRAEVGLYGTATPVTLGLLYRGVPLPGAARTQQILTAVAGVAFGAFRVGYSYDMSLNQFSADLGGAHELSLAIRQFDVLDAAWRRLKRQNSPAIPCPAF